MPTPYVVLIIGIVSLGGGYLLWNSAAAKHVMEYLNSVRGKIELLTTNLAELERKIQEMPHEDPAWTGFHQQHLAVHRKAMRVVGDFRRCDKVDGTRVLVFLPQIELMEMAVTCSHFVTRLDEAIIEVSRVMADISAVELTSAVTHLHVPEAEV